MANNFYQAVILIGGLVGALDAIDGAALAEGDAAEVHTNGMVYFYYLDATSGAAESSPSIIKPDTNAGTKRWIKQSIGGVATDVIEYIRLHDSKATDVDGGTFTLGAWRTRTVTEDFDTGNHCSVASSVIVLDAGTYDCKIRCPAFRVLNHAARLYNTSDAATVLMGSTAYTYASRWTQSDSWINGRFTIGAAKNLEIQHRCSDSQSTNGMGEATNYLETEIYTVAEFWKIS